MFQSWRLKLREAEQALKRGQPDEARRRLLEDGLVSFFPGQQLAARVGHELVLRARRHARNGDAAAAWRDAAAARELAGEDRELVELGRELAASTTREVETKLEAGETAAARRLIETMEKYCTTSGWLEELREVTQRLQSAEHLARRGKFAEAQEQLASVETIRPDWHWLEERRQAALQKQELSRPLTEQLHRALAASSWSEAVTLADQLLALAPECRLARDARRRAWARVGARCSDSACLAMTRAWSSQPAPPREGASPRSTSQRFALWVDGVGGYLLVLGDEATLGQSAPGNAVDIPIQADLARRHARIRRSGEGYSLEPLHVVRVNGRAVQNRTLLSDGDEIELGSVRLSFRRPHPLSATARLDFISRHRTTPSADGVLLMAESCVLGPKSGNHIVCRDWSGDVVLYRQDQTLCCRAMEPIEIDGRWCDGRGQLESDAHIAGSDFSMSLEELDRCSTQPLL